MWNLSQHGASDMSNNDNALAFALCGKIGTRYVRAKDNPRADPSIIQEAHTSFAMHLMAPARAIFSRVEVFIHVWNPEVEGLVRKLYAPRRAAFETSPRTVPSIPRPTSDDVRTFSYARAIHRVMRLVMADTLKYDYVFLSRLDVIWRVPFSFAHIDPDHIILPQHCSPTKLTSQPNDSPIGCRPLWMTSLDDDMCTDYLCAHNAYLRRLATLDMWMVGPFAGVQTFSSIGDNATYVHILQRMRTHRPAWVAPHTMWGLHLANKPVRYINHDEWIDWMIARYPSGRPPHRPFATCHENMTVPYSTSIEKCRTRFLCTREYCTKRAHPSKRVA